MSPSNKYPQSATSHSHGNKLIAQVNEQKFEIQDLMIHLKSLQKENKLLAQVQEHSPAIEIISQLHE